MFVLKQNLKVLISEVRTRDDEHMSQKGNESGRKVFLHFLES